MTLAQYWLDVAGLVYAAGSVVLGLILIAGATAVWRDTGDTAAKRLFGYSIVYLFLVFALLILDRIPAGLS